jgi:hypothetical protein
MIITIVGAVAAGAGAASRYGSGSDQMMRLRLRNTTLFSDFCMIEMVVNVNPKSKILV